MLASTRRMYHIARVLIRYRLHEYLPDEGAFRWLRLAARLHPAYYQDDGEAASLGKRLRLACAPWQFLRHYPPALVLAHAHPGTDLGAIAPATTAIALLIKRADANTRAGDDTSRCIHQFRHHASVTRGALPDQLSPFVSRRFAQS